MRRIARVIITFSFIANTATLAAAESGSSWWPFGHHDDAPATTPPVATATSPTSPFQTPLPAGPIAPNVGAAAPMAGAAPAPGSIAPGAAAGPLAHQAQMPTTADPADKDHWMLKSQDSKVSWPHLTKPHMPTTGIFADKPKADPAKNSWTAKTPAQPKPSPLKPITDGANKVTATTKSAWHKTVTALTPGSSTQTRSNTSPRVAKREVDPPFWKRMFGAKSEVQQPQTVPQWMAQQRVDP